MYLRRNLCSDVLHRPGLVRRAATAIYSTKPTSPSPFDQLSTHSKISTASTVCSIEPWLSEGEKNVLLVPRPLRLLLLCIVRPVYPVTVAGDTGSGLCHALRAGLQAVEPPPQVTPSTNKGGRNPRDVAERIDPHDSSRARSRSVSLSAGRQPPGRPGSTSDTEKPDGREQRGHRRWRKPSSRKAVRSFRSRKVCNARAGRHPSSHAVPGLRGPLPVSAFPVVLEGHAHRPSRTLRLSRPPRTKRVPAWVSSHDVWHTAYNIGGTMYPSRGSTFSAQRQRLY